MTSRIKRAWRWIAGTFAALAIVSALAVGAFRLAIDLLPDYQVRVAQTLRAATGLQLTFDSLDARIGRYGPEIYFRGARVIDADGSELTAAPAGRASLSPLRSLWFRRLEIGRVVLESPRLNLLVFPDRHVELVGQAGFVRPEGAPRRPASLERVPRGVFEVRNATLAFRDLGASGATWELTRVNLEFSRQGSDIRLQGEVRLPDALGNSIGFRARASGELASLDRVAWQGRVEANDVDLAGWVQLLPEHWPLPPSGAGSFRLSARGQGKSLQRARAVLDMKDVVLPAADPAVAVRYTALAGDLLAERNRDGWRVDGDALEFSLPGAAWRRSDLEATLALRDGRLEEATLRSGFIRADNLLPLLALAPDSPLRQRIEGLAPRGILRDVDLRIVPAGAGQLPDLSGSARFDDVGFAAFGRFPGVAGVDGSIEGRGAMTLLRLDAAGVEVDYPEQWRSTMPFDTVRGTVELSRAVGGVRIASDDAFVATGHGQASGRLRMLARRGETPLMDLDATARIDDLSRVPGYLPKARLSPNALEWLDRAFPAGRVRDAHVQITGPIRGFPYREGQGRFAATAEAAGVTLDYAPGWQPLTGVDARVEFDGPSLRVTASAGAVGGIRLDGGTAEIQDFRDGFLVVRAQASTDAGAVRGFFAASPLAPRLGATFERLSGAGPVTGEVVMYLPIKQFDDKVITVQGRADGVALALDGIAEPATGIEGEFWVRNRELQAPRLTGSFLGGDLTATIASRSEANGDVATRVEAAGRLDGARLPHVARLPLDAGLEGTTSWSGSWVLRRPADPAEPASGRVLLRSDLRGLASGLPAPLDKLAPESRPLQAQLDIAPGGDLQLRAALGNQLRALLEWRREDGRLQLARGAVRLGGGEVSALPVAPGLSIDGRLPYLSISQLTSLRWPGQGSRKLQDLLAAVSLDVGRLEVLGREFDGVRGRLRASNRAWDVEVEAAAVQGRLRVPYEFPGDVPLVADLQRLRVGPALRQGDAEPDPRRLPAMRIDIRDLVFQDWKLGHLVARLDHDPDGIRLEEFTASHPAFEARGSGAWRAQGGTSRSDLTLRVDSGDVRGFLDAMVLAPVIEASKGWLEAEVSWPRGPDAQLLERISGKARLRLSEGRLLTVEPGAGRLLGLMSLSHVGRRLALDFDDVTSDGLSFDTVKGDFALASGEAYTDNLTLRGPGAEVGIAGRTSLRERSYDQTAVVTGELGASLGVAGVIAGGPAVGAALLLFSQIFKEPLKGVARGYYRITGPWDDPVVKKIDARELQEAAGLGTPPGGGAEE